MGLLYVILLLIVAPFLVIVIINLISEFWEDIVKSIKNFLSCSGQIIFVLVSILLVLLVYGWLFRECTHYDPDSINYDYDPHMHKKY